MSFLKKIAMMIMVEWSSHLPKRLCQDGSCDCSCAGERCQGGFKEGQF